jgi:pimeloyl-ACP methyl ester carboxylesterase
MIVTKKLYCPFSKGLVIGEPVVDLVDWLNAETPEGIHFVTVGGADPELSAMGTIADVIAKAKDGYTIIAGGHSMGGMLAFYLAQAMNAEGLKAPLFVSIDPTDWGTDAPGVPEWSEVVFAPNTGEYFVPPNVDVWLHFYQDSYPGGGIAKLAPGNTHTDLQVTHLANDNHLSIVNDPVTRDAILKAVLAAAA